MYMYICLWRMRTMIGSTREYAIECECMTNTRDCFISVLCKEKLNTDKRGNGNDSTHAPAKRSSKA